MQPTKVKMLCIKRFDPDSRKYIKVLSGLPFVEEVVEADFHYRVGTTEENKAFLKSLPLSHRSYYKKFNIDPEYFIDKSLEELVDDYLSQVDMVYIPGSSFDPEAEHCVDHPKNGSPDVRRERFEIQIIKRAKEHGIPVLAVCAGSWRLANVFGGKTIGLPPQEVAMHEKWDGIRDMTEPTELMEGSSLHHIHLNAQQNRSIVYQDGRAERELAITKDKYQNFNKGILKVNTTHTRVSLKPEDQPNTAFHRFFKTSAIDQMTKTVEAFESEYGVPMMGVQFHPEYAIPALRDANGGGREVEDYKTHRSILTAFVQAGLAYKSKKNVLQAIRLMEPFNI
jgi:gamma-glutamyl-gamma-aminobutyrate hydrolase PuuD